MKRATTTSIPRNTRKAALAALVAGALAAGAIAAVAVAGPAAAADAGGYWHTSGSQILDGNNQPVRLAGVNWYGFETTDKVVHGLWNTDYRTIVDGIKASGYNVIRLPFSNDVVEHPVVPAAVGFYGQDGPVNTDLKGLDSLGVMDHIIDYAGQIGLKVNLDDHRSEAGNSAEQNGLWYTPDYPESAWINDWTTLARRYADNPAVIGADLRNEPHTPSGGKYGDGATWGTGNPATDFRLAAQKAGNAILAVNPHWLISVEGISDYVSDAGVADSDWWGGNLQGVQEHPLTLDVPNQLAYSPHDYGPDEFQQTWFNGQTTYDSLAAVWHKNWGYIADENLAPVWVGEFGVPNSDVSGTAPGSEGQWFSSLVQYIKSKPQLGWTYWALNGEDRYGLLDSQYKSTSDSAAKQALLATIQAPASTTTTPAGTQVCDQFGSAQVNGGRYIVQNNEWGDTIPQCVDAVDGGFTVTSGNHNLPTTGAPAAYPSIYAGCHYGNCSAGSGLPLQVSKFGTVTSQVNYTTTGGQWDAAYDIWLDTAPNPAGQNDGAEIMIWGAHSDGPQPVGAKKATVDLGGATWDVWEGPLTSAGVTWNVVSYVRQQNANALNVDIKSFTQDAVSRGYAQTSWYLTSVQFGFEPWQGGPGLSANSFSFTANAADGGGTTGQCKVTHAVQSSWDGGFTANVTVTNTGTTAVTNWKATWTAAAGVNLVNGWNATVSQSGSTVDAQAPSWQPDLAPGQSWTIGYQATGPAAPAPSAYALNGTTCS